MEKTMPLWRILRMWGDYIKAILPLNRWINVFQKQNIYIYACLSKLAVGSFTAMDVLLESNLECRGFHPHPCLDVSRKDPPLLAWPPLWLLSMLQHLCGLLCATRNWFPYINECIFIVSPFLFVQTSLHGSCPVIRGEKWVATKWIRDQVGK